VPNNDGGIALGQIVAAKWQLTEATSPPAGMPPDDIPAMAT
jgi:hypothetical protein